MLQLQCSFFLHYKNTKMKYEVKVNNKKRMYIVNGRKSISNNLEKTLYNHKPESFVLALRPVL